jgi:hypothetical protein
MRGLELSERTLPDYEYTSRTHNKASGQNSSLLCLADPNRMLLVKFCVKLPKWQPKVMANPKNCHEFMRQVALQRV